MKNKMKVGLVYGGKSGEHEISLQTAFAVMKAFDLSKYDLIPFYITRQGEWRKGKRITTAPETIEQLTFGPEEAVNGVLPLFQSSSAEMLARADELTVSTSSVAKSVQKQEGTEVPDVIFPLLHGTYGEDGTIQGLLEMANIPYVGAGVLASAVGMDKVLMKKIFAEAGLPQCIYRHFIRTQWEKDQEYYLMEIEISIGYPCFVKPANLGSSVGISKVNHRDELIEAIEYAFQYDRKVIVEEFVEAREVEVGVLGNDDPQASVAGEIVSSSDFYDYKAKYLDGKSAMIIPAKLDEKKSKEIREMAIRAFRAIDGSGLSRVDFFVRKLDGAIFINEINTMPGFTPFSMYPLLWKESGVSYQQLLNRLIALALERYNEKQQLKYGMES